MQGVPYPSEKLLGPSKNLPQGDLRNAFFVTLPKCDYNLARTETEAVLLIHGAVGGRLNIFGESSKEAAMRMQAEIEESIRQNLAIIFGKSESVEDSTFLAKYNALVDYAAAVSEPFLRAETIRYQSMLLYVSLVLLTLSVFQIGTVKLGEITVAVNNRLLIIYMIFIATISVIFLIKAHVDFQRAQFVRTKNDQVFAELNQLLSIGLLKKRIQDYFWYKIMDIIGPAYKAYHDARSRALNAQPSYEYRSLELLSLDLNELRKIPELAAEIQTQESHIATLNAELSTDEASFRNKAEVILSSAPTAQSGEKIPFSYDVLEKLRLAYEQYLRKWFEACDSLATEHLSLKRREMADNPEKRRVDAMAAVLKRIWTVRRIYAALEIYAPVAFAIVAILYIWFP